MIQTKKIKWIKQAMNKIIMKLIKKIHNQIKEVKMTKWLNNKYLKIIQNKQINKNKIFKKKMVYN